MTMADTLSPVGAVVVHRQSGDKPGQLRFRHCGSGGHRIRKRTHGVRTVRARCAHGSGNTPFVRHPHLLVLNHLDRAGCSPLPDLTTLEAISRGRIMVSFSVHFSHTWFFHC